MADQPLNPRICVLIPHFPSQTAAFFWREIGALERLGVPVIVTSTRPPEASEICHAWSREAIARTTYLFPLTPARLGRALLGLAGGAGGWGRCLGAVHAAAGLGSGARMRLLGLVLLGGELARVARRRGATHLHAHSCADAAFIVLFASLLTGIPYSLTLHGRLTGYGPGQNIKWGLARFGITVNQALRKDVLEGVAGLDESRIDVVAMGVDTGRFARTTPYRAPAAGEVLRLVSCGRLHEGKGHQDVLRAMADLRRRGLGVELDLLGEGPARGMLESLVAELGLGGCVRLAGAVDEAAVRDHLDRAHAFVLASHDEAIGVATMEAMAMELPVVVARVGGVGELVRDAVEGLMVPPRDPAALAEALARLGTDPELCERLGRAGRERVVGEFGSERSARVLASRLGAGLGGGA